MSVRRFTSESHPDGGRRAAWQEPVGALGLRADVLASTGDAHATASLRGELDGITVVRFAAGPQALISAAVDSA